MVENYIGQIDSEDGLITIVQKDNKLVAGGITNCGLIEEYTHNIDNNISLDENLNDFINQIVVQT